MLFCRSIGAFPELTSGPFNEQLWALCRHGAAVETVNAIRALLVLVKRTAQTALLLGRQVGSQHSAPWLYRCRVSSGSIAVSKLSVYQESNSDEVGIIDSVRSSGNEQYLVVRIVITRCTVLRLRGFRPDEPRTFKYYCQELLAEGNRYRPPESPCDSPHFSFNLLRLKHKDQRRCIVW